MEATKTATPSISRDKFTLILTSLLGHNPDPDGEPQPPGPWDPVIRQTFEKVFGPFSQPWNTRFESIDQKLRIAARAKPEIWDVIGGRFDRVALNPQPLPPRWAFGVEFIRLAVDRLTLIQETADAIHTGDQRGIIIVGGKVSELVDFVCGNVPRRVPVPPDPEPEPRFTGPELVVMGAEFVHSSKMITNEALAQELTAAGEKLIDAGLERL